MASSSDNRDSPFSNPRSSLSSNPRRTSFQIHPSTSSARNSAALSSVSGSGAEGGNRASVLSTSATDTTKHRLVLITGATGGTGRATAVAFARTGQYNLALHYHSASEETREKLFEAINDAVTAVIDVALFQADLEEFDQVRRLHKEVNEGFGKGVDILFNNAGTTSSLSSVASLADVPIDIFERTWRVNTGSPIFLTQLCLPHMEAQQYGRIIFNSSVAALNGGVVGPHYASSKSGLHGFVHWLGLNIAKKGITVNAVAPALIEGTTMLPGGGDTGALAERIPVGRLGRPEEVAETVLWMVNTGFVTRKIIAVDGGYHAY